MYTLKTFFQQLPKMKVSKCLMLHVLSGAFKVVCFEFWKNERKRSNRVVILPTTLFSITSVYTLKECRLTILLATFGLWGPCSHIKIPILLQTLLTKKRLKSVLTNVRLDINFTRIISNLFRSSRLFDCDIVYCESFLWELCWKRNSQ